MVYVAIMGHGVVGSGVAEVLLKNADSIAKKAGKSIEVKRILDLREFPDSPFADRFTKDFNDILNDEDIRIVVETMGGLHPSYEFVKACLESGKSVVTSNKELVAAKGDELLTIAREKNLNFLFEASVGGGIPILRPLDQCLAANEVAEIAGILNGTTNFMLTKMIEDNMGFDEALKLAQDLGYAEREPSADVDGHDAARKICILASLAFGRHVFPDQVHTEGIRNVSLDDVRCAEKMGGVIKLIGRAKKQGDKISCVVAPMVVDAESNLLAQVRDVFNGIMVRGDVIGDVLFYGRGAGKLPTASAVVADVIDEVKHIEKRKTLFWESGNVDYVLPYTADSTAAMVRVKNAAPAQIERVFGAVRVLYHEGDEIGFVTPVMTEDALAAAVNAVETISCIRVAE